jgi:hypothetical protein
MYSDSRALSKSHHEQVNRYRSRINLQSDALGAMRPAERNFEPVKVSRVVFG